MKFSRQSISSNIASINKEAEERDIARRIKEEGFPRFENQVPIDKKIVRKIEEQTARAARAAVINEDEYTITVIVYTTIGERIESLIKELSLGGKEINIFLTSIGTLNQVWSAYQKISINKLIRKDISGSIDINEDVIDRIGGVSKNIENIKNIFKNIDERKETKEILSNILGSALILGASDIHIETVSKIESRIRFRVDGILKDITNIPNNISASIIRRTKLLSKLKLNIKDSAQDGRFTIKSQWGDIEIRSSIVPSEYGESVTLRVLDPRGLSTEIESLGIRIDEIEIIKNMLKEPNGMILVTGPTGSGKTTTLYAFLRKAQSSEIKIITIEDPIEYHIKGIEQTQINKVSGYSFSEGVKSTLRQDPDIILVGEIRDKETADAAVQASLTGHLVLSTLHTNNAAGAIPRLIDLGIKQSLIGPSISLVIAQRLIRRLCSDCKEEIQLDENIISKIDNFIIGLPNKVSRENIKKKLYKAIGCDNCTDGYSGRMAISELLVVDAEIESIIKENPTEDFIEKTAIEKSEMVLIQKDGIIKALEGATTLEEVEKETGPIKW